MAKPCTGRLTNLSIRARGQVYSLGVPQTIWVARLDVSAATATKISSKHGLEAADVRQAIVGVPGIPFKWDNDPARGGRAILEVLIQGQTVAVVLYPVEDPLGDRWALGSAYPQ
jgi:hypothetical protein